MDLIFDMLTPRQTNLTCIAVLFAAIVCALVTGRVFLMPYSVSRNTNARAFYALLAIIGGALLVSVWRLIKIN